MYPRHPSWPMLLSLQALVIHFDDNVTCCSQMPSNTGLISNKRLFDVSNICHMDMVIYDHDFMTLSCVMFCLGIFVRYMNWFMCPYICL